MTIKIISCIVLLAFANILNSQTKVGSLFGDHMVLQQNTEVAVWGTDKPKTKININASWGENKSVTSDENGKWRLLIKTKVAGGPYNLEIKGTETINIKDVLLGEVWLCSGQSNMEMPMKGFAGQPITDSNDLVLESKNTRLRLFNVKRNISEIPLETCEGTWQESYPNTVLNFSAVAYLYGKMLQEKLNVPVGIICSSVGGTRVEAWTNSTDLSKMYSELKIIDSQKKKETNKNTSSVLYNGMIKPLIPYGIKGVIWYQGESNRSNSEHYTNLFKNMIYSWRNEWNIGEFPFYFVQIAPFQYKKETNSALLREAQLNTLLTASNTGMVVTLDIGEALFIHPPRKIEVAKRLSYWALAKTYGLEGIQYSGPVYKSMQIENDKVILEFDYAPLGVSNFGKPLSNFTIAGSDKVFYPAKAEIVRGKLSVSSDQVPTPVAVRYGWDNYLEGTLYNLAGLPASSFRTDDWVD